MKVLSAFEEGRMTEDTLRVISTTFVETVHIELPDEGVHF